ncbi:MAG: beta-propeller fold lactonase family protein [Rhizomicrobium sp.]|nr:beta-propeller fold lactonase family protein [Rhizomicrobium sp.]
MSRWRRIAVTVAAMLVVLSLAANFRYGQSRGVFAGVADKTPASCKPLAGLSGVVTIIPDEPTHSALIATRDGGIFLLKGAAATKLTGTPQDFHPLAMAAAGGKLTTAFQRKDGYAIAVFDIGSGKLTETSRLTTDQLSDPADLLAVDALRFYLINHHKTHSALGRWLDDVFLIPRAEVQFFDGLKFVTVSKRLNAPSALATSPDGAMLYVAQELPRNLAYFQRNAFSGALGEVEIFALPAAPTKISIAKDGSLIVAAWVKPGQGAVYRIAVASGVPQSAELLYASKGHVVTAAAELGDQLLIATDQALLSCAQPQ